MDFSLQRLFYCLLYGLVPFLHKYMTAIVKRSDDFILPGWKQKTKTENDWRGPYIPTTNPYAQ